MWLALCVRVRVHMSGVARMGADARRSGDSFGIVCPCPLACERPQNSASSF